MGSGAEPEHPVTAAATRNRMPRRTSNLRMVHFLGGRDDEPRAGTLPVRSQNGPPAGGRVAMDASRLAVAVPPGDRPMRNKVRVVITRGFGQRNRPQSGDGRRGREDPVRPAGPPPSSGGG